MSVVISDTSPVSALFRIGRLSILPTLYGDVLIPPSVYTELLNLTLFGYDLTSLHSAAWLKVVAPSNHQLVSILRQSLDAGEAEAIALAKEYDASLLIIDEKKGRSVAQDMQLSFIGVLGVLLEAKETGMIHAVKPL